MDLEPNVVATPDDTDAPSVSYHEDIQAVNNAGKSSSRTRDILRKCTSVGLGTLLGLLSRTGMIILCNELLKTELSGVVWSNFLACFCMGLFVKAFGVFGLPKDHNVYLGLTVGFCGTFSSYSSAALELFNTAAGRAHNLPSKNNTESSRDVTAVIVTKNLSNFAGATFVHIGVSFIGYHAGDRTATLILKDGAPRFLRWSRDNSLTLTVSSISLSILIIISTLIQIFFLRDENFFIYVTSALLLALPGTSLRYALGKELNFDKRKNRRSFPLGTFIANALGSLILATITLTTLGIQPKHAPLNKTDKLLIPYCVIPSAVGHGFCGALTTMSTFIAELSSMENRHVYLYTISSVTVTVGCFVVIWGSYSWAVGYASKSACL